MLDETHRGTPRAARKMKTILVVDDESIVTAWKRVLQLEGYRVVTASNGREGLVVANEEIPDLIITDRSMSITDGVEFCRHLKLQREFARIPVILTSADPPGPGDSSMGWVLAKARAHRDVASIGATPFERVFMTQLIRSVLRRAPPVGWNTCAILSEVT